MKTDFPTLKLSSLDILNSSSDFCQKFGDLLAEYQLVFLDISELEQGKFNGLIENARTFFPKMMREMSMVQRSAFDNGFFREGTYYSRPESEYGAGENRFWLHFCDKHEAYLNAYAALVNTASPLPEAFCNYFLTIQSLFPKIENLSTHLLACLERYLGFEAKKISSLVFDETGKKPTENTLLSIEYTPPPLLPPNTEIEGMGEHTGPCLATIGITQSETGLQVKRGGRWLTVPRKPGHIFFMADDQLDFLSRKARKNFPAVSHRVQMYDKHRTSILYFMSPFKDAVTGPNGERSQDYIEARHPNPTDVKDENDLLVVGRD